MKHGNAGYVGGCKCSVCKRGHANANNAYYHANGLRLRARAAALAAAKPKRICRRCGTADAEGKSQFCSQCKIAKQEERRVTAKLAGRKRRRDPEVRRQDAEAAAAYRARYPERIKAANQKQRAVRPHLRQYGTTLAAVEEMTRAQGNACLICGAVCALVVDHDHDTGQVRGLLCGNCNRGLGMFHESPETLRRAALYVEMFQCACYEHVLKREAI